MGVKGRPLDVNSTTRKTWMERSGKLQPIQVQDGTPVFQHLDLIADEETLRNELGTLPFFTIRNYARLIGVSELMLKGNVGKKDMIDTVLWARSLSGVVSPAREPSCVEMDSDMPIDVHVILHSIADGRWDKYLREIAKAAVDRKKELDAM